MILNEIDAKNGNDGIGEHAYVDIGEHVCVGIGIGEYVSDNHDEFTRHGIADNSGGGRRAGRSYADPRGTIDVAKPLLLVISNCTLACNIAPTIL
jgi:hypothetical protein